MKCNFTFKSLSGVIILAGALLLCGCKKEQRQATTTTTNNNSPYYITGLLGTEAVTISGPATPYLDTVTIYVDSNGHEYYNTHDDHNGNDQSRTQYVTGAQWIADSASSGAQFVKGSLQILQKLSVRIFVAAISVPASTYFYENLLVPGNIAFADSIDPDDGAVITVRDGQGVLWSSQGHDQTGSSFVINSRGDNMGTYTIIKGSVKAKMYDSHGNMKQLSSTGFIAMVGL